MTRQAVRSGIAHVFVFVLLWWGIVTLIVVTLHYAVWLWAKLGPG